MIEVDLLTADEVADRFRVHVGTVWAWRRAGRIEAIHTPGGRLRFTEQAIQDARNALEQDGNDGNDHSGGRLPGDPAGAPPDGLAAEVAPPDPCPFDTNGDGDCGRWACPHCGKGRAYA